MAPLPLLEATVRWLMGLPSLPATAQPHANRHGLPEGGRLPPRSLRDQRRGLPPAPGLLTDAEIVRALRRFRYDPEFRGPKRVPFRALADLVGLSHQTIYVTMLPNLPMRPRKIEISECTRAKLSPAITAILEGRLRFRRVKQVWTVEGSMLRPRR
jgi:hypothetical protein